MTVQPVIGPDGQVRYQLNPDPAPAPNLDPAATVPVPPPVAVPVPDHATQAPAPATQPVTAGPPTQAQTQAPDWARAAPPTQPAPAEPVKPSVTLDLDALDRETATGKKPAPPFTFRAGGRKWTLNDPFELDYQITLAVMSNPLRLIQALLPEAEQAEFLTVRMAGWKLEALLDAFMNHHGLPPLEELARQGALPGRT